MLRRHFTILPVLPALGWLGACVSRPSGQASTQVLGAYSKAALLALLPQDAILLGEQHDAAEHQSIHALATETLAERGLLAALVIEMAEAGRSTQGLTADATETQVKQNLDWNDRAWSWASYGPAIMAAVRAGVAVFGANLAREPVRAATTRYPRGPLQLAAGKPDRADDARADRARRQHGADRASAGQGRKDRAAAGWHGACRPHRRYPRTLAW
jgi:hypothetical protein